MPANGKKLMTAKLDISSMSEMNKKAVEFIASIPAFKKKFKDFTYTEKLELDPRKWDERKLATAMKSLVRWELKLLAGRVAEWQGKIQKQGPKAQKDAERSLPKYYDEISKKITDKCSIALEELGSDKGDNKKGLRDGKASLKKLGEIDLGKLFSGPGLKASKTMQTLAKDLEKFEEDEKRIETAYVTAIKILDEARKSYDDEAEDAESAIKFLEKTAADIKKNKETAPELDAYGKKIEGYSKAFKDFTADLRAFEVDMDDVALDTKSRKLNPQLAKAKGTKIANTGGHDRAAKAVQKALVDLRKDFAKVEKALK
ncbi:MAG: hypothetical protein AAFR17_16135 [Pseudomonadota bacterium]